LESFADTMKAVVRDFHFTSIAYLLIAFVIISSCGTSKTTNIEQGYDYEYKIGYPELKASAFGYWDSDNGPTLSVSLDIVKGSLIYTNTNDSLAANYTIDIQVNNLDDGSATTPGIYKQKTFSSANTDVGLSQDVIPHSYEFSVDPGEYEIVFNVEDLNTDKSLTQTIRTSIPKLASKELTPSNIQMSGKINGEDWQDLNTYNVPGKVDSLRFVFQVISNNNKKDLTINSRLLRFKSDTSRTRPMQYADYSNSSLEARGIRYDESTEVQSNRRVLTDYGNVFIEYKFANQQRGNYRFEVDLKRGQQDAFRGRAFGIRSEHFPHIKSPEEMVGPLAYLMNKNDFERFQQISNTDSLKKAIDTFWLKNIGNTSKAKNVIQLFYERVENANKQFSNFKEGWKTDRGMIYILFGPPWYTIDGFKSLEWYYSNNHQQAELSYTFEQPRLENEFFPFEHYILNRSTNYYSIQYQQRELWLSGMILQKRVF
jgi:GWxTD domain-containing protein